MTDRKKNSWIVNPHDKLFRETYSNKETGGFVMTLAEKLHNEGKLEGLLEGEKKGEIKGLREAIELGVTLKFPGDIDTVMSHVKAIEELTTLIKIKEAIKTARNISDILILLK